MGGGQMKRYNNTDMDKEYTIRVNRDGGRHGNHRDSYMAVCNGRTIGEG
jgi:hypothetical protein